MNDQATTPERTPASWIDSAAKLSATAILVIYVAGFLIVSIQNARYGIVQHDLVRPRLLATGVIFFVLLAIGVFAGSVVFRVLLFKEDRVFDDPKHLTYLHLGRHFDVLVGSIGSSLLISSFFASEERRVRFWVALAIIMGAYFVHVYLQITRLQTSPRLVTALAALLFLGSTAVLIKIGPASLFARIAWFTAIGALTPIVMRLFGDLKVLLEGLWAALIGAAILVIVSFAIFLYPKMRASIGGGEPVPVVLQFKDKSPLDPTQTKAFGWVLDESDAGFYLLKNDQDKDAIFVPRTDVTLVFYGDPERIKKLIKP